MLMVNRKKQCNCLWVWLVKQTWGQNNVIRIVFSSELFLHVSSHFVKVGCPNFCMCIFDFLWKLRGRKSESHALDIPWPSAGSASTCSWETWLKDSKECASVDLRGFVYVNTRGCSQGIYSLLADAIDTHTSALTRFVSKLCKVTFKLSAHFIFWRTLRN